MSQKINLLLAGASGYLGGTFLTDITQKPEFKGFKVFASTRKPEQVSAVEKLGAVSLQFDLNDKDAVRKVLLDNDITIVVNLADGTNPANPTNFIEALGAVKDKLGPETVTHYLNPSGCKLFSPHAGLSPDDMPLSDLGNTTWLVHHQQTSDNPVLKKALECNRITTELGAKLGVRTYVLGTATIYGESRGFGNKLTGSQPVDLVKIALQLGQMRNFAAAGDFWPIAHIEDFNSLLLTLASTWLPNAPHEAPYGENGYYFAISHNFDWQEVAQTLASELKKQGLTETDKVIQASSEDRDRVAEILGIPRGLVDMQTCGRTDLLAQNARSLGWEPKYLEDTFLANLLSDTGHVVEQLMKHGKMNVGPVGIRGE